MLQINGLDELIKRLKDAEENIPKQAKEVLKTNLEEIFAETQIRVPKKTGALAESGRIEYDTEGEHPSGNIIYGDSDVDRIGVFYAAAVHEILDAEHEPPTGPKYVEGPLMEGVEKFKKDLAKAAQKALGKKTL